MNKKTKSEINLRRKPTVKSSVLTVIPAGTVVTVSEEAGTWSETEFKGLVGYVKSSYLEDLP